MKKIFFDSSFSLFILSSCSVYNFTGTGKIDAKTFQVFQNNAELIEPAIDRTFTYIARYHHESNQSQFGKSGGDLVYEGEIVDYRISPMTATADQQASQNRLKIRVNVRFTNRNKEIDNFERTLNSFYDYPINNFLEPL
jgi:hypothetical protein